MGSNLLPKSATVVLIAGLVVIPIAIALIWGVSALLSALGDSPGANALKYVGLALGILWAIDLVCLVLLQALASLGDRDGPPEG